MYGGHLVEGSEIFSTCEMGIAEIDGIDFMRIMDKHTRVGEIYGIELEGKSYTQVKKAISDRKKRPKPNGVM